MLLFATFSLLFHSCSKDISSSKEENEPNIQFRTSTVTKNGELLNFLDHGSFENTMEFLFSQDSQDSICNLNFNTLGITTTIQNSGLFYTDYPACKVFENQLGFISKRRIEEDSINSRLNQGDNNVFSMVKNPYLKTVLNQYNCVKVGNRIYKYFTDDIVGVITNNDLTVYDQVKLQTYSQALQGFNFRIYHVDERDNIFNSDGTDKLIKIISIAQKRNLDGSISLINNSIVEYQSASNPVFSWVFSDGTTYVGRQPNKTLTDGTFVSTYTKDPVNPTITDTTRTEWRACISIFDNNGKGNAIKIAPNKFELSYPITDCVESVTWSFDDGTTLIGNKVVKDFTNFDNTKPIRVRACVKFKPGCVNPPIPPNPNIPFDQGSPGDSGVTCCGQFFLVPSFECTGKGEKSAISDNMSYPNGEIWRIEALIWVKVPFLSTSTPDEIGCRTKSFRRKSNGSFEYRKCQRIGAHLDGLFVTNANTCLIGTIQELEFGDNSRNLQINYNHNGARKLSEMLFSRHFVDVANHREYGIFDGAQNLILF